VPEPTPPSPTPPDAGKTLSPLAQALDFAVDLAVPDVSGLAAATPSNDTAFERLVERMRHQGSFPSLSAAVINIQSAANSENQSVSELTNEVLKDVALTQRLLRLVNSVNYAHPNRGTVSTVSRAVSLVGFDAVRNLALSLVLLEHMKDTRHAAQVQDEFLRALMAGSVASGLCTLASESEEAFIGAMFQNLGRMLATFYFPGEAGEVRRLVASGTYESGEEGASIKVMGVSFEDFGVGVARLWSLPESIQRCMHRPLGLPPPRPPELPLERLRWAAATGNAVVDSLLLGGGGHLSMVAERYARCLNRLPKDVIIAATKGREKLTALAEALVIEPAPGSVARQLLLPPDTAATQAAEDPLAQLALRASPPVPPGAPAKRRNGPEVLELLAAGVHEIAAVMSEPYQTNDVVRMVLETMFRALAFRRIVFCLRDGRADTLSGRFGLGEGCDAVAQTMKIDLKAQGDLFAAVCAKGVDTLITNATDARMATRLPAWYRKDVGAQSFLLLPLLARGKPFALIYADQDAPGGIGVDEQELALLRTLRNQAVAAFRLPN
jgi:HD-like signal output (HDOD) protein/GAF domain-containing protein